MTAHRFPTSITFWTPLPTTARRCHFGKLPGTAYDLAESDGHWVAIALDDGRDVIAQAEHVTEDQP